jgi:sporulation protein YlmC with PRC-barrel domain
MTKYLAAALLTTVLFTCTASAQTASNKAAAADRAASSHKEGEWRASKLVGVNVYNEANEKIGDINDVILDKAGKVENVVLGVGGFLGMGEHYVAVAYDKLKWSNEPPRGSRSRHGDHDVADRSAEGHGRVCHCRMGQGVRLGSDRGHGARGGGDVGDLVRAFLRRRETWNECLKPKLRAHRYAALEGEKKWPTRT